MTSSKILPAAALVSIIFGSGAMVATAQTAPVAEPGATEAPMNKVHAKGDRGDHAAKGDRGDRAGKHHRGQQMMGGFGGHEGLGALFAEVDADDDGTVTRAEIDSYLAGKITGADASGDGALTIEEFDTLYREFTRTRMVRAFQRLDADGDGQIDAAEIDTNLNSIVDRMDRDGDGALTLKKR